MHERARATDANSPIYAPLKARGRDDVPEYYGTSNAVPRMVHEGVSESHREFKSLTQSYPRAE